MLVIINLQFCLLADASDISRLKYEAAPAGEEVEGVIPDWINCAVELVEFLAEPTSEKNIEMFRATAKDIDDYGNYTKCKEQEDLGVARYVALTVNTTAIPIKVVLGLCLPRVCTKSMYDSATKAITSVLNEYVPSLVVNIKAADHLILPTSTYEVYVQLETEFQDQKRDDKKSGAIVIVVLLCLLALISVGSGIYEEWQERRDGGAPDDGPPVNSLKQEEELIGLDLTEEELNPNIQEAKYWTMYKAGRDSLSRSQRSNLLSQVSTFFTNDSLSGGNGTRTMTRPFSLESAVSNERYKTEERRSLPESRHNEEQRQESQ